MCHINGPLLPGIRNDHMDLSCFRDRSFFIAKQRLCDMKRKDVSDRHTVSLT